MKFYFRKFTYANYIQILYPETDRLNMTNISQVVEHIIQEYNFIGVTERMDESLVVLKLLMGLELNDILYLKASKGHGSFDDGGFNGSCVYIVPSFISPGMQEYFDNNSTWKNMMKGDEMMYQAAYKSLDLTINALGRHVVEEEVQEFRRAMKVAQQTCTNVRFPCSSGGTKQNNDCLSSDLACGYKCLERLAIE